MGCSPSQEVPKENTVNVVDQQPRRTEYDIMKKVLLLGESTVGKSSILLRYAEGVFEETFVATIGVDFKVKDYVVNNKKVRLQIWDTAGQERYRTITSTYFRGVGGIIIVFDVTNKKSYEGIERWISEVNKHTTQNDFVKILVGNKIDLENQRCVTKEEGVKMAKKIDAHYVEVSAKSGKNIDSIFQTLLDDKKLLNV